MRHKLTISEFSGPKIDNELKLSPGSGPKNMLKSPDILQNLLNLNIFIFPTTISYINFSNFNIIRAVLLNLPIMDDYSYIKKI